MPTRKLQSWSSFKTAIGDYAKLSKSDRALRVFRGHGNSRWALESTLDRRRNFDSDPERNTCFDELLQDFKHESMHISDRDLNEYRGQALMLLARHHGLPTPVLDWTSSPYIAAYFACSSSEPNATHIAIWALSRDGFLEQDTDIGIIDDLELVRNNERALQQKAVFLRISSIESRVESFFGNNLMRWTLPKKCCHEALNDLDEMGINNRSLLMSMDSAARTAAVRAGMA